jgi:hypothetical protein
VTLSRSRRLTPRERPAAHRFLAGGQSRRFELLHAFRTFAEHLGGLRALRDVGPCVTVFGSARLGPDDPAHDLARRLGRSLAEAGFAVMTGGGPGVMAAANRGAQEVGGRSIGCNIRLPVEQVPNPYLDTVVTFDHFFIRKVMLVKYSSGFVALAAGYGTYDEVFEAATLIQTGKIESLPIVLVGTEFWSPLVALLRHDLLARGTIDEADIERFLVTDSVEDAVRHIQSASAASRR